MLIILQVFYGIATAIAVGSLLDIAYTLQKMYNRMPTPPASGDDFEPSDYCPKCEENDLED
jgi:hypothetical protein